MSWSGPKPYLLVYFPRHLKFIYLSSNMEFLKIEEMEKVKEILLFSPRE